MQDEFSDVELFRITTELAIESTVAEEDKWLTDMHQFLSTGVVEKTVPRRKPDITCINQPLYVGTSFVVLYIVRYKSTDVKILGRKHSLGRKSRRISVRKDRE